MSTETASRRVFVLVHSPLVGPATWEPVAAELRARDHEVVVPRLPDLRATPPPRTAACIDAVIEAIVAAGATEVVLVGHSGAGLLLPAISADARIGVRVTVFVDCEVPPVGTAAVAPGWLRDHVEQLAVDGIVPPWSRWWGPDAMTALVPDDDVRARVEVELPRLPLDYFDEHVDVPADWPAPTGAYVQLSELFGPDVDAAAARGWPVERIRGGHLHAVVDPADVATRIARLAERVSRAPGA